MRAFHIEKKQQVLTSQHHLPLLPVRTQMLPRPQWPPAPTSWCSNQATQSIYQPSLQSNFWNNQFKQILKKNHYYHGEVFHMKNPMAVTASTNITKQYSHNYTERACYGNLANHWSKTLEARNQQVSFYFTLEITLLKFVHVLWKWL